MARLLFRFVCWPNSKGSFPLLRLLFCSEEIGFFYRDCCCCCCLFSVCFHSSYLFLNILWCVGSWPSLVVGSICQPFSTWRRTFCCRVGLSPWTGCHPVPAALSRWSRRSIMLLYVCCAAKAEPIVFVDLVEALNRFEDLNHISTFSSLHQCCQADAFQLLFIRCSFLVRDESDQSFLNSFKHLDPPPSTATMRRPRAQALVVQMTCTAELDS